ncbi:MAG: inositol monophosphatase [Deltaproteobacteria bacterium]|nr:inositol monophosphatase [Deltaproteobacteria bacterium]
MSTERLNLMKQTVLKAGEIISSEKYRKVVCAKSNYNDLLTEADLASEVIIMEAIRRAYPNDKILSEETGDQVSDVWQEEHLWIIDPVDGTSNFKFQRSHSCISIGYSEKGVLMAGVVYNPYVQELFSAQKGKGAYLNEQPINVSSQDDLVKAAVGTDNCYTAEGTRFNLETILKLKSTPWTFITGSAVLGMCRVAAGSLDLYFHTALKPWDNAAALLLCAEAGGVALNLTGKQATFMDSSIVMGNEPLLRAFVEQINR